MACSYGVRNPVNLQAMTLVEHPQIGATLYDFFNVQRMPNNPHLRTLSTGSKLAAHMRNIDELKWAEDEIHWTDQEEDPVEVPPCDIGEIIKDLELRTHMGINGKSMKRADVQHTPQHSTSAEKTKQSTTLFDPCNYPPPWPLVPFSALTHNLQKRIPFHLLPQKLIVHDPWNLLSVQDIVEDSGSSEGSSTVNGHSGDDTDWTAKDDIIRTYNLELSTAGKGTAKMEKESRAELDRKSRDTSQRESFLHMPDSETSGPVEPAIMVFPPPRPPPPESVPEAHLYLSPAHRSGTGNHSVIYKAELELPRSILVDDVLCRKCMMDKVAEQVEEKKRRSEYPYNGVRKEGCGDAESLGESSRSATTPNHKSAKVTFSDNYSPAITMEFISAEHKTKQENKKDGDNEKMDDGKDKSNHKFYTVKPAQTTRTRTYEGPIVEVFPDMEWQNPERGPYCSHLQESSRCKQSPVTAKVSVAAKLSIQYDKHLTREAHNYQSFPSHLFDHWNGYNVIPPLHDPVPVGAVVPQFYGYYVSETKTNAKTSPYLSPILLIENCGIPIEPESLDIDNRQECASLLYRFHEAGWNHGSFAPRNILMQPGPLSAWPPFRGLQDTLSFRLIDFGRSLECTSVSRAEEESVADKALRVGLALL
jgi:hypothetical protein